MGEISVNGDGDGDTEYGDIGKMEIDVLNMEILERWRWRY